MQLDQPNFEVPLAASYNERGIDGYASTVTNGLDQRKINSMYEPVVNAITGKTTLYLLKRPGIIDSGDTAGSSSDSPYLVIKEPNGGSGRRWLISQNGNVVKANNTLTSTTVLNQANIHPAYVSKTLVSGTEYVVLQIRKTDTFTQRVFYSSAIGTWTEIIDANFAGIDHRGQMVFMDGFAFMLGGDNYIYNSDLNSLATWQATNRIAKQSQQDSAQGLMRFKTYVLACGEMTTEVFYNAGYANASPLETIPQLATPIGLASISGNGNDAGFSTHARHYYATTKDGIYFLGREASRGNQFCGLYRFNGSAFDKVSTPSVEKLLHKSGFLPSHVCTVPIGTTVGIGISLSLITDSPQIWLLYVPAWNEWFEWTSTFAQPVNDGYYFIGIGGASSANRFGYMADTNVWADGVAGANSYTMTHQFQLPKSGHQRKSMRFCGVAGDTARSAQNLSVEFSDDDGQTFSSARTIDMTADKKELYRCGNYRNRLVRLSHAGNTEVRLEKFLARID